MESDECVGVTHTHTKKNTTHKTTVQKSAQAENDRGLPVTDWHQEIFWRGGEELKICNVQLLHLDRLTELNNKPESMDRSDSKGDDDIRFS